MLSTLAHPCDHCPVCPARRCTHVLRWLWQESRLVQNRATPIGRRAQAESQARMRRQQTNVQHRAKQRGLSRRARTWVGRARQVHAAEAVHGIKCAALLGPPERGPVPGAAARCSHRSRCRTWHARHARHATRLGRRPASRARLHARWPRLLLLLACCCCCRRCLVLVLGAEAQQAQHEARQLTI